MMKELIETKLHQAINPNHLEVINESYMHNVPPNSESHFKVVIVSDSFNEMRLIARHRLINQVLADELSQQIHALSMHTYTQQEWRQKNQLPPTSPKCAGGSN